MAASGEKTWPANQVRPFLDYLTAECGLALNTIRAYRHDLQRFVAFCQTRGLADPKNVSAGNLQQYARTLAKGQLQHVAGAHRRPGRSPITKLSTTSVARHLVSVRMFFRFHVLGGEISRDVSTLLEMPKPWQRLPQVLNRRHTVELIEAVDPADGLHLRDRALLELLYATGMRASEAAGLEENDINSQVGFVRVFGKGGRERVIPVHTGALHALREYLDVLKPTLIGERRVIRVFVSRTGRPLSRIEVWRIVRRAALRAGLTGKITPHTLRHCFGSHLLQSGADLRSVQEMLGHASVATTQIYTHVDHEHLRAMHRRYHPRA